MKLSLTFLLSAILGTASLVACTASTTASSPGEDGTDGRGDRADTDVGSDESSVTKEAYGDGGRKPRADAGDAGGEPDGATSPTCTETFTRKEASALLAARCAPCHTTGSAAGLNLAGDFRKTTVNVPSTQLPEMKRIEEGDKERSYLFHKLRGTHMDVRGTGARMPKNGPPYLSDDEIARIGAFIDAL